MLRQYGPSVPEDVLQKLVRAFGELRSRADQGLISYPYSTREVVSVVKHLQVRLGTHRERGGVEYITNLSCTFDVSSRLTRGVCGSLCQVVDNKQ